MTQKPRNPVVVATACLAISVFIGIAGQYVAEVLFLFFAIQTLTKTQAFGPRLALAWKTLRVPTVFALLFCVWQSISTGLNSAHGVNPFVTWGGMTEWWLFPLLAVAVYPVFGQISEAKVRKIVLILLGITAVACLTQLLTGWKFEENQLLFAEKRARGFFSHPLTLAYAGLALLPPAVFYLRARLRERGAWAIVFLVVWILLGSLSRVAIGVGGIFLFLSLFSFDLPKAFKVAAIAACVAIGIAIVAVPNPLRERLAQSFEERSEDRHTEYRDDRLAFWDAHRLMVQERPWIGHGVHLDGAYRKPYYEKLGLGTFEKQYEAHNTWLQELAEGGVIGLSLMIFWIVSWMVTYSKQIPGLPLWQSPGVQSLVLLGVGGITQNSFQDAKVRFTLTCVLAFSFLLIESVRGTAKPSLSLR